MAKKRIKAYKHRPLYLQLISYVLILLFGVLLFYEILTSMFISTAVIGSRSMQPTLEPGSRVFISRIPYGMEFPFTELLLHRFADPSYGDLVLIDSAYSESRHIPVVSDLWAFFTLNSRFPGDEGNSWEQGRVVRRVIALPGDRVYINNGEAYVQIQGKGDFLPEAVLSDKAYDITLPDADQMHPDLLMNHYTETISIGEGQMFILPDNRAEAFGSPSWGLSPMDELRGKIIGTY